MDELIHGYFKKGERQGFSKEYVRDTLIKKGYDAMRVRMIYNSLVPKSEDASPLQPESRFYNLASSAGADIHHPIGESKNSLTLILAIALGVLFLIGATAFFFHAGNGVPTGAVVLDEARTKDAQAALEGISAHDDEILRKSRLIQEQLDEIGKLELTNEEKAQLIGRQLHEIQELHKQMGTQREEIHALLWGLMKDILSQGQTDPRYE